MLPPTIIMAPTSDSARPRPVNIHVINENLASNNVVFTLRRVPTLNVSNNSLYSRKIFSSSSALTEIIIGSIIIT